MQVNLAQPTSISAKAITGFLDKTHQANVQGIGSGDGCRSNNRRRPLTRSSRGCNREGAVFVDVSSNLVSRRAIPLHFKDGVRIISHEDIIITGLSCRDKGVSQIKGCTLQTNTIRNRSQNTNNDATEGVSTKCLSHIRNAVSISRSRRLHYIANVVGATIGGRDMIQVGLLIPVRRTERLYRPKPERCVYVCHLNLLLRKFNRTILIVNRV